jgi:hypothetical protein
MTVCLYINGICHVLLDQHPTLLQLTKSCTNKRYTQMNGRRSWHHFCLLSLCVSGLGFLCCKWVLFGTRKHQIPKTLLRDNLQTQKSWNLTWTELGSNNKINGTKNKSSSSKYHLTHQFCECATTATFALYNIVQGELLHLPSNIWSACKRKQWSCWIICCGFLTLAAFCIV